MRTLPHDLRYKLKEPIGALAKNDKEFGRYLRLALKNSKRFKKEIRTMVKKHDLKVVGKRLKEVYEKVIEKEKFKYGYKGNF